MPSLLPPDDELIARLREGDEGAFVAIFDAWNGSLRRLARSFVRSDSLADEVLQETWTAVFKGIHRFEGRSALKTWVFTILANRARSRGSREARTVPMSALGGADDAPNSEDFDRRGHWLKPPVKWDEHSAEALLLSREAARVIEGAMEELPPRQREVVMLRDVEGLPADVVCNVLEISESNQRVLLHRGRSKLRDALARHLTGGAAA